MQQQRCLQEVRLCEVQTAMFELHPNQHNMCLNSRLPGTSTSSTSTLSYSSSQPTGSVSFLQPSTISMPDLPLSSSCPSLSAPPRKSSSCSRTQGHVQVQVYAQALATGSVRNVAGEFRSEIGRCNAPPW